MFKKLKDKIAEEVKQSPLKSVQQLAQAVVSPSSSSVFEPSSSNDKFCIEEGDIEEAEKQEQAKPGGFTSVTLTGQTASPIRDQTQKYGFRSSSGSLMAEADNLFPKFEPQPTNFHVQSDWESASEVEDRYSQLEHINKESLYEAYRKVYNRYNRMKNKYHEVVTHYRQLEREKEKAKTVLTETQDKALLRISELREQCLLEQQAKAHLEEALRNELEEQDHIINTLKTKVQYLKGVSDSPATENLDTTQLSKEEANLIDFTEKSNVSTVPLPFDASNSEEKITWFEEKLKTLKILLNEETTKIENMRSKLKEELKQSNDVEDADLDNSEAFVSEEKTEKELNKALSHLITKLATEVQNLQKNAVHSSLLKSVNSKENFLSMLTDDNNEEIRPTALKNVYDEQHDETNKYADEMRQLEEQNKVLIQRLQEESFSVKELKNELNTLNTITDVLRRKIKLSNENFGKNDAINCLITDMQNELIQEWNLCFQNFLQTRCEITVLKDTRDDLEKELLRMKEEKNKSENSFKEITEKNNKMKEDLEVLQKELKSYLSQIENLSKERSDFQISNENLERQIKKLEETVKLNEKKFGKREGDVQNIMDEKITVETKLASLESELQKLGTKYSLLVEKKKKVDTEVSSLRKENDYLITEKEALNSKINEMEKTLKNVEDDYKTLLGVREELDDKINSLTKETEELTSEKRILLTKISNLEKDLENNKSQTSLLLEEKEKLLQVMKSIKDEKETINRDKHSITEKYHDLVSEVENNKQNYLKSLESTQQRSDELLSLRKERDELIMEKNILESDIKKLKANCAVVGKIKDSLSEELLSVKEERDKLISEIQSIQNRIVEVDLSSKAANEELSFIKKQHAELITEKISMQDEIKRLEECLKSNIENHSSSSEMNTKLSKELDSLKKEKDDLIKERNSLESQSKRLEVELSSSKEELSMLTTEHKKISGKLQVLQMEHDDLVLKNKIEKDTLGQIQNDLKEKVEELLSVNENNNELTGEIEKLKNKHGRLEEEYESLQKKFNSITAECGNNKALIASLSEIKNKLSDEVVSLKKECENAFDVLSQTQLQLLKEQNTSSELENQLGSLSESLKEKCDEINEKYKENVRLTSEIDTFIEKINALNSCIEKLTNEKDILLNYLLASLNNVKMIKELQKNLCDFVKQFQVEISREINNINLKMSHDLLKHLSDLLVRETFGKKILELECKSKEDIDSYNSKLKNLQGPLNNADDIFQEKATILESACSVENELDSKMVKFSRMGHLEKSCEQGGCISNDEQKTFNPQIYLKQAISLMKSFTNLLNHNSVINDYSVDIFAPNNEKCIRLNEVEGQNLQKEIVAMESFITDYETKYNENNSSNIVFHKLDESDDNINILETQLRQEIKLKDDIIKKLQAVIEEYEQIKDVEDSEFLYKQKVFVLEQENHFLSQKLKQIQETHELNIKNIISEYEKKLEEEKDHYDLEKFGKEKNYVVNEMKEQIQNLQQDLEERGDAFEKLYEEHQQSVKSLDQEIHQIRSNHDKEIREQDKKWRQCLDRRLAEEEARHQQELASLNMQWNAERRELETARRLAVNAVESGSGSNELLRRQVQALTVQLTELHNNRCEACDRKRKTEVGQDHSPRSIQDCTEMEYLRNILYEYMMGKEPLVLAKVLCALVKFDENQTKEIVSKEEHRITLFGQLGLL